MVPEVVKVGDALSGVVRLFLDTAPVIYFTEQHPTFFPVVEPLFDAIDEGSPGAVTSPVTLAECLVGPLRSGLRTLEQRFTDLIVGGYNTTFVTIDQSIGRRAADIRAHYNLLLPDALQVAIALESGCDAILTNDGTIRRVTELRVILVNELEL